MASAKYRIVPTDYAFAITSDTYYWKLEKRTLFGWRYVATDSDKENLEKLVKHLQTTPKYL